MREWRVRSSRGDIWSFRCSHQSACVPVNKDRKVHSEMEINAESDSSCVGNELSLQDDGFQCVM